MDATNVVYSADGVASLALATLTKRNMIAQGAFHDIDEFVMVIANRLGRLRRWSLGVRGCVFRPRALFNAQPKV